MDRKPNYGKYGEDEESQSFLGNKNNNNENNDGKIIYLKKQDKYKISKNSKKVNKKERAIQGFVIILITILFCFSGLILMHIHDKQHIIFKSETFLQSSFSFLSKYTNAKIIRPNVDSTEYKLMVLENDLKVLLISDPQAQLAAGAIDVKTGYWNEPNEWPGLAHFLEHMEFQSTEKSLDNVLSLNQGMSNAYTSTENTNYYFNVAPTALNETLEVFANMFSIPKFQQQNVERESSAVNGEYEIDISMDGWKLENLVNLISNENHPGSRFSIGNTDTLRKDGVIEALNEYFDNNYSSNLMSLVVSSPQSIEDIQKQVKEAGFDKIKNKKLKQTNFEERGNPLKEDIMGNIVKMNINSSNKYLSILTQTNHLRNTPENNGVSFIDYIFYILENQEENGFQDLVEKSDLIEDVDFGFQSTSNYYSIFVTEFQLTSKGMKHIEKVINLYYTALEKIKQDGLNQELYNQRRDYEMMNFNFTQMSGTFEDSVSSIARTLNNIKDAEKVLVSPYQYDEFDQQKIEELIGDLKNPNKQVFVVSTNFGGKQSIRQDGENSIENNFTSFIQNRLRVRKTTETHKNKKKNEEKKLKNKSEQEENIVELLKLHEDFIEKQELQNYNELYNLRWDRMEFGEEGLKFIQEIDEKMFHKMKFPKMNNYIPQQLDMISLCDDSNFNLDLSYQLKQIFGFSTDSEKKNTEFISNTNNDQEKDNIYENGNRYQKFIYEAFDVDSLNDMEQCIIEEIQYEHDHKYPQLLKDDIRGKLFYKLERTFQIPQSVFLSNLKSTQIVLSPKSTMALALFNSLLQRKIEKEFAEPISADYNIQMQASQLGIQIYIQGWSEHFSEVVSKVFIALKEMEITQADLKQAKQEIKANLSEYKVLNPLKQAMNLKIPEILLQPHTTTEKYLLLVDQIDLEYVQHTKKDLISNFKMNTMIMGNILEKEVEILYENITDLYDGSFQDIEIEQINNKIGNLKNESYVFRKFTNGPDDDLNSATVNYYQFGKQTLESTSAMNLLQNLLNSFFFQYLRTDRELGYQAFAKDISLSCVKGFVIGVQGSKEAPNKVDQIIEEGLKEFEQFLKNMKEEDFENLQESGKIEFQEYFITLEEKAMFYFSYISSGNYLFDEFDLIRKQYSSKITKDMFVKFFEDMFKKNSGKLSVQVYSKQKFDELPKNVLKKSQSYAKQKQTLIKDQNITEIHSNKDYVCSYQVSQK